MSELSVYVRMDLEIRVDLPGDDPIDDDDGEPTKEAYERAVGAALSALPQNVQIFIEGEDRDPAEVFIEAGEHDITEVRVE